MKKYNGIVALIIEIDNVNEIDKTTFAELECGDKVIIKNNGEQEMFTLNKITSSSMSFVSQNAEYIKEIIFTKTDGAWAYNKTKTLSYANLTIDGNLLVKGTLSVGTPAVYDISDIDDGDTISRDRLTQILQAFASGKIVKGGSYVYAIARYKNYDEEQAYSQVLNMASIYEADGDISEKTMTFEKQEDGSLFVTTEEL